MKLEDYKKDGFKVLNLLGANQKALTIESVRYIDRLSLLSNTEIRDWDLTALFGTGEGSLLILDRNQINQRFFAHKETLPAATAIESIQLPDCVHLAALKAKQLRVSSLNAPLERSVQLNREEIRRLSRSITTYTQKIQGLHLQIVENEHRATVDVSYHVKKIIHEGFWSFWDMEADFVDFVNVTTLRCHHDLPKLGIQEEIDLGFIRVRFHFSYGAITLFPHQNNRIYEEHQFHPHMFQDGSVCFGSGTDRMAQCLAEGDISGVFSLLAHLLTQYNTNSPTVRMSTLADIKPVNTQAPASPLRLGTDEEFYWECERCTRSQAASFERCCRYYVYDGEEVDEDSDEARNGDALRVYGAITRKIRKLTPVSNPKEFQLSTEIMNNVPIARYPVSDDALDAIRYDTMPIPDQRPTREVNW